MQAQVLVVTGPTGGGKSSLALEIAETYGGEIVNADSVQVYQDFDIGSAKPSTEELSRVPHHLYSVVHPEEAFDAQRFRVMALACIEEIRERRKLPVVVGGTGLYIRSLLCGLVVAEEPTEEALDQIAAKEIEFGIDTLEKAEFGKRMHTWLADLDARTAERLQSNDLVRIKRALEVRLSSGESLSELQDAHAHSSVEYDALVLGVLPERERLYEAINARVDTMLAEGFLDEVRALRARYARDARAFSSIGYRHMLSFLEEQESFETAVELMKRDTRRFAKRQMTWWRNQPASLGWNIYQGAVEIAKLGEISSKDITFVEISSS